MTNQSTNINDGKNSQGISEASRQTAPDAASQQSESIGDSFAKQFEQGNSQTMNKYKEAAGSIIQSGEMLSKALEEINQQMMTAFHDSIEANAAVAKAMLNVGTAKDFFTVQSEWFRGSIERAVKEITKFSSWSIKAANEIAEPVQERYKAAANTFGKVR